MTSRADTSPQHNSDPNAPPVLVAVDFSDDSRAALLWACDFSNCTGAQLVVLHVVHDPAESPGFYRAERKENLQPMQDVAELKMAEFLGQVKRTNPTVAALQSARTQLVPGLPSGRIVEMAEFLSARAIVIGSRGLSGLPHLLLGSVAAQVVQLANEPVVVVKAKNIGQKKVPTNPSSTQPPEEGQADG